MWLPTNIKHPTGQNWRGSARRNSQTSQIQGWMIRKKAHTQAHVVAKKDKERAKGLNSFDQVDVSLFILQ